MGKRTGKEKIEWKQKTKQKRGEREEWEGFVYHFTSIDSRHPV